MIIAWLTLSLPIQVTIIAVAGFCVGAIANHAIYALAYYNVRSISPWMATADEHPDRYWSDRIPVWGWLGLRRESSIYGRGHWWRPLAIELGFAIALVVYYFYAVRWGGLLPPAGRDPGFLALYRPQACAMFFTHFVLAGLLVAATFIDFDERIIPDFITIPGTLFGILAGSMSTFIFPPTVIGDMLLPTTYDSPWFTPTGGGLGIAIAILAVWCFALCDRRASLRLARRRGFGVAVYRFFSILSRSVYTYVSLAMFVVGVIFLVSMSRIGGTHWLGCLTSMIGLAVGGGIVWSIRIVASVALGRPAMGFGDVTLMAMIGSMVGWQATLLAFFVAPFTAIVIVIVRWILTRDVETPFGPYLSAGTVLVIVFWDAIYNDRFAVQLFLLGRFLLLLAVVMLIAMAVMLSVWRVIRSRLLGD